MDWLGWLLLAFFLLLTVHIFVCLYLHSARGQHLLSCITSPSSTATSATIAIKDSSSSLAPNIHEDVDVDLPVVSPVVSLGWESQQQHIAATSRMHQPSSSEVHLLDGFNNSRDNSLAVLEDLGRQEESTQDSRSSHQIGVVGGAMSLRRHNGGKHRKVSMSTADFDDL